MTLNGERAQARTQETNLGNLITDAMEDMPQRTSHINLISQSLTVVVFELQLKKVRLLKMTS